MIEKCVSSIRSWMRVNRLKLNDAKTEVILFGTKSNLQKVENTRVRIGSETICQTQCVRNLGFYMSSTLSVRQHKVECSASYFILKKLTRIKHYMDMDTRKNAVTSSGNQQARLL